MAGNAEMIIIAFRGTEPTTLQDWMTDLKIRRKTGPYGKVHRGFLKGFQVVWPEIRSVIKNWQTQAQSLWLTGHSLGGALANLSKYGFSLSREHQLYRVS